MPRRGRKRAIFGARHRKTQHAAARQRERLHDRQTNNVLRTGTPLQPATTRPESQSLTAAQLRRKSLFLLDLLIKAHIYFGSSQQGWWTGRRAQGALRNQKHV